MIAQWWRIIEMTIALDLGTEEAPKPVDYYNVTLKMTPARAPFVCPDTLEPGTPAGYYAPLGGLPAYGHADDGSPNVHYWNSGTSIPNVPDPDHTSNNWGFPVFGVASGLPPAGFYDTAWNDAGNRARCIVVGPGHMSIYLPVGYEDEVFGVYDLTVNYLDGVAMHTVETRLGVRPGPNAEVDIPASVEGVGHVICNFWVDIEFQTDGGAAGRRAVGFGGFDWAPA